MAKEAEIKFLQVQDALNGLKSVSKNFKFEKSASIHKISQVEMPQLDLENDFKRELELQRQNFEKK